MMRNLLFYTIFLSFLCNSLYGQNSDSEKHTYEESSKTIRNNTVIEAKLLNHQGEYEKSLKMGLNILLSKETLTPIDSFYTYQILAYNFDNLKAYDPALSYAKLALEISVRTNFENKPHDVWIAHFFHNMGQYDSSIVYLQKEIKRATIAKDTSSFLKYCNNLGWSYYKKQTDREGY